MTNITELYRDDELIGFRIEGHANYSIPGRDIVCAAVSSLTINTINCLLQIGGVQPVVNEDTESINYCVLGKVDVIAHTLLLAAHIGYKSIAEQYPENVILTERR